MKINTVIKVLAAVLASTYIGLQAFQYEMLGTGVSSLVLVLLTYLYCKTSDRRQKFFFLFLLTFTTAQVISYLSWFIPISWFNNFDLIYYLGNILYMLSYILLIMYVIHNMNIKEVFKRFKGPIIILLILSVFCVIVVTDAAESEFNYSEYALEFTYNGIIMALLSVALINYLLRDNNRSMLFLIGSIFIAFSEIIQLAHFYVLSSNDLSATYATFLVMAFLFFYIQSQMLEEPTFDLLQDEQAKA